MPSDKYKVEKQIQKSYPLIFLKIVEYSTKKEYPIRRNLVEETDTNQLDISSIESLKNVKFKYEYKME